MPDVIQELSLQFRVHSFIKHVWKLWEQRHQPSTPHPLAAPEDSPKYHRTPALRLLIEAHWGRGCICQLHVSPRLHIPEWHDNWTPCLRHLCSKECRHGMRCSLQRSRPHASRGTSFQAAVGITANRAALVVHGPLFGRPDSGPLLLQVASF